MLSSPLFPLPDSLELTSVSDTPEEVLVRVTSHRSNSPCPHCSTPSSAIHSLYRRHPKDLPCAGRPIRLLFTVINSAHRESREPRREQGPGHALDHECPLEQD